nr:InlB B-repeat-containing protein [Bacilli bacterium]
MKKFGLFILVLLVSIILFGCKGKKEETSNVNFNIRLNDYIGIDRNYDLVAVDDNGNSVDAQWSIDDDSLATLEGNKITGISAGLLGVKASYKGKEVEKIVVVDECKTIKYELDGGTCELLEEEIFKNISYALPTPTKAGYVFEGWYSNPTFSGTEVTELNSKNYNISTLYALWHSEKYEIKYVLVKDGVEEETKEEDLFTSDYPLTNPTYD